MKKLLKLNLLAVAIIVGCAACNNNDGTSTPKGDKVMVDSFGSGGSSSSQSATGASGSPGTASPSPTATDTGSNMQNKGAADSSTMKKP